MYAGNRKFQLNKSIIIFAKLTTNTYGFPEIYYWSGNISKHFLSRNSSIVMNDYYIFLYKLIRDSDIKKII